MCDVLNEVDFAKLEDARFPSKKQSEKRRRVDGVTYFVYNSMTQARKIRIELNKECPFSRGADHSNLAVRPGLLEAWLALTRVKYHGNLLVLIALNQRLALTRP